ncbi:relA-associated inhibitor isoform X1 [Nerophis lumbriciformis]|uniref:relA-associated inhibitor isoform X1 n=1 Tax=Nerophis lumbriciformis TaxID=546530 RepID=UPI002ADFB072|nr:relA-associated inhibitor isoform X1 [Nerophis lumbriciformis]XP_061828342.1 relA-associated inhibitor isoform X1 [Nerophis lumbriciformis]
MTFQPSYDSNMLFQTINDDLNASLATADELSKEFNTLLHKNTQVPPQRASGSWSNVSPALVPHTPSTASLHQMDPKGSISKSAPTTPASSVSPLSSPKISRAHSPHPRGVPDSLSYRQMSPKQSPGSPRRSLPAHYDRSPRGSLGGTERSLSPGPAPISRLSPYDGGQVGRRSPRADRCPSPLSFQQSPADTLQRQFVSRKSDEGVQRHKSHGKWNETDLDMSYESKPHHTYDKTEWVRTSLPNSNWRESNLDGPSPAATLKKNPPRSQPPPFSHGSLARNTRVAIPPDIASSSQLHQYSPQPIISRISIPPASAQSRQRRPIPLSVIMRLQNPQWGAMAIHHPGMPGEPREIPYQLGVSRNFFKQAGIQPPPPPPELRQPAIYSDALNPGDIDAELGRLDLVYHMPMIREGEPSMQAPPRPLSPTRLQPVVAPDAQSQEIPDLEEVLRLRAEIPRPLKRRGSAEQMRPLKKASHYEPNQYKHLINKMFQRKNRRPKGERGSESSSSSDGEDNGVVLPPPQAPQPLSPLDNKSCFPFQNYHSILRRSNRERKGAGRRARLSPLVLALDGALVGELETVQRAVQEMQDPSQPNDEGITALHNAICGGHYKVVDFLVRIGANVSSPDSHGWTPLHCAASCNDRPLCEFLVRNGAAVMAMTESDGATAAQKCDPYAIGFEECENFLRGVEEAMGMENSGVLYALWSYPAQAPDELGFREGDMVTILQKKEASDWWWASLCGREGYVPNNYFGLFPKVRPKCIS